MSERNTFQTATVAQFRQIAETAQAAGKLDEVIKAITDRLERHHAMLQLYESTQDFQRVRETRRVIENLESKLEIARKLEAR